MVIIEKPALTYDDVLLEPRYSTIESRSEVDISTELFGNKYALPIISANMDTVTDYNMAFRMGSSGGIGFIHRYGDPFEVYKLIKNANEYIIKDIVKGIIPSVGVGHTDLAMALEFFKTGTPAVCIDIAHGHSKRMIELISNIRKHCSDREKYRYIVAGNVATGEGVVDLANAGADVIKVGIGPSGVCSTRGVTGHGVPQLTALDACIEAAQYSSKKLGRKISIIADGGIRSSGDIVKALAIGADAVMIGGLLAGTDEAPGNGVYRGMASEEAQINHHGRVNNNAAEGISVKVSPKGPVKDVLERLAGGIRSGLSYSGARNLKELREKAIFRVISHAGAVESTTYANKG